MFDRFKKYSYIPKALRYNIPSNEDLHVFEHIKVDSAKSPFSFNVYSTNQNRYNISQEFKKLAKKYKTHSFVVLHKNRIIHEQYWDGYGRKSETNLWSTAKSIVAVLVGIAIQENMINSENDEVCKYLPSFVSGVTIKHCLNMASGLDYWGDDKPTLFSPSTRLYYTKDQKKVVFDLSIVNEPGTVYKYKSADTQIVAFILEKVYEMDIATLTSNKIWSKIGTSQPAKWQVDRKGGHIKASCCFFSNAIDIAKFGLLVMKEGNWQGKKLYSQEWAKKMIEPIMIPDENNEIVDYYCMHIWKKIKEPIYYLRGINGQFTITIPEEDLVVVRLGHKRESEAELESNSFNILIKEALAIKQHYSIK